MKPISQKPRTRRPATDRALASLATALRRAGVEAEVSLSATRDGRPDLALPGKGLAIDIVPSGAAKHASASGRREAVEAYTGMTWVPVTIAEATTHLRRTLPRLLSWR